MRGLILAFIITYSLSAVAGLVHYEKMIDTYPWIDDTRLTRKPHACMLCHLPRSDEHNNYGDHYFLSGWYSGEHDFKLIELIDSDGDGYTNIEELRSLTNPGDPKDSPDNN